MTQILAFDTSAESCSVALWIDGDCEIRQELAPRRHAQLLLPMIQDVMSARQRQFADLDLIAFGRGPGSFTGLRIAAGVAQGLSFGADIPVMPISNLKAMALQAAESGKQGPILSVIDARMDEVYWGLFEAQLDQSSGKVLEVQTIGDEKVSPPEKVMLAGSQPCYGIGNGLQFKDRFPVETQDSLAGLNKDAIPQAQTVAKLAYLEWQAGRKGVEALEAKPVYIRDEVAWKKLPGR